MVRKLWGTKMKINWKWWPAWLVWGAVLTVIILSYGCTFNEAVYQRPIDDRLLAAVEVRSRYVVGGIQELARFSFWLQQDAPDKMWYGFVSEMGTLQIITGKRPDATFFNLDAVDLYGVKHWHEPCRWELQALDLEVYDERVY